MHEWVTFHLTRGRRANSVDTPVEDRILNALGRQGTILGPRLLHDLRR